MADKYKLTEGALSIMMTGGIVENPMMQIMGSKKIVSNQERERYRVLLSDGKYSISSAMFTAQAGMSSHDLDSFTVIKIKRYVTSVVNNTGKTSDKRVLIILDMEVVVPGNEVRKKIGEPVPLSESASASSTPASSAREEVSGPPPAKKPYIAAANSSMSVEDQVTNPISSLTPYQNKWIVKVRLTNKSPIRTWSNARGEGKLFSFDILDNSGEMRVTAFKELVDKYYDFLQVDKVYYISKCQVKMANKQFSTLKNDYELTLNNDSVIQECIEQDNNVPTTTFNFTTIDKVGKLELGAVVDLLAVVVTASEMQTFTAKTTGRELKKRELTLIDTSKTTVSLTLWGNDAETYNYTNPVVAIKGAKLSEFGGGKQLGLQGGSIIKFNPDLPQAYDLRGWYDSGVSTEDLPNISARTGTGNFQTEWLSFKDVKNRGLGNAERGDFYQTKGTILLVKSDNIFYKACPQESCNKKVIDMEQGQYRCEKCNAEYPNFKYRLIGNMNVGDWSGSQWISTFTTEAERILGKSSQDVGQAAEANEEEFNDIINEANFKQFIFKCRAKMETYNDEARLKTVAVKVEPINYKEYNKFLISEIQQMASVHV